MNVTLCSLLSRSQQERKTFCPEQVRLILLVRDSAKLRGPLGNVLGSKGRGPVHLAYHFFIF